MIPKTDIETETVAVVELVKLSAATELLFANDSEKKLYWDRSHYDSPESQMRALAQSKTLYVGNLAFSTRSNNILSHFSLIGHVRKIHMGLDRFRKTPCGFCFVEYYRRADALQAVAHLSETKLDGRVIRVELDAGFQPGRQYGRGVSGGQVRDDRRNRHDPARSGQRHRPKWTPPVKAEATTTAAGDGSDAPQGDGHYGPSAGEKRGRDDDDQEMETDKRYREE
jgi:nuclear cap-binding protein subunit 2